MRPPISTVAVFLITCLYAGASVRADDFNQTASQAIDSAGASIKTSLKAVGTEKPPVVSPVKLEFDSNVPKSTRLQIGRDLAFVSAIQGSGATPLHEKVFGKVDGPTYIKWFTDRARSVGYDPDDEDVAYVDISTDSDADHSKIWLAQGYMKKGRPQIERVDDVFHEARHTEDANGNWEHVDCPDPYKDDKGKDVVDSTGGKVAGLEGGCDKSPIGAYGIAAIMLKNIQRFCVSQGCTRKLRADAGIIAADDVKRVIGKQAAQDIQADLYQ